jgi:hypothetical protein
MVPKDETKPTPEVFLGFGVLRFPDCEVGEKFSFFSNA